MTAQPLTFVAFASRYRLRTKRDACRNPIAIGKLGHLYEHDAGRAGIVLEDNANGQSRARSLLARRRKALAAGFRLHQAGDAEAILLFELGNLAQERLAIALVQAKRRRISSSRQLEALRRAREVFKSSATLAQRAPQNAETHALSSKVGRG